MRPGRLPSHLEYILFAVEQQREAEEFGFTRNLACRNLKLALKFHWQNKTLGQRNLAREKLRRSAAARRRPLGQCIVEHAVPLQVIVDIIVDDRGLDHRVPRGIALASVPSASSYEGRGSAPRRGRPALQDARGLEW